MLLLNFYFKIVQNLLLDKFKSSVVTVSLLDSSKPHCVTRDNLSLFLGRKENVLFKDAVNFSGYTHTVSTRSVPIHRNTDFSRATHFVVCQCSPVPRNGWMFVGYLCFLLYLAPMWFIAFICDVTDLSLRCHWWMWGLFLPNFKFLCEKNTNICCKLHTPLNNHNCYVYIKLVTKDFISSRFT
jgi:hypothetical protein